MARRVSWSKIAQQQRKTILEFWKKNNGSSTYSKKLNTLFVQSAKLLSRYPSIGRKSNVDGVRVKVIRDYLMFYHATDSEIQILLMWDSRRDITSLSSLGYV